MHRVGTLPPGALGEDPDEAGQLDGVPEPVDTDPTGPDRPARQAPDATLFEVMLSHIRWERTTAEELRLTDGIGEYGELVTAHDVPWGELHIGFVDTFDRIVIVRYVEETPDEEHVLDPMLTYDVYTWVDGKRRLRSYVISMTELEP